MHDKNPTRRLALTWFKDIFSDLISANDEFADFERSFIESLLGVLWFEKDKHDFKEMEKTARATFFFLKEGSKKDLKTIAEVFINVVNNLSAPLNDVWGTRVKLSEEDDHDKLVVGYLSYYKKLYEGIAALCLAPPIMGIAIANNSKDKSFKVTQEGKINLTALWKIQKWLNHPKKARLSIGINSHVRNAYSHEHYNVLDDGYVELWDRNPNRPYNSWGPETWHVDKLKRLCEELWSNCQGVCLGLILYSIKSRKLIKKLNLNIPTPTHTMRIDELENIIGTLADKLSFNSSDVLKQGDKLKFTLSTLHRGIDQVEEIYIGGDKWSRAFKVPVKYEEVGILEQTLGYLQQLELCLSNISHVEIKIRNEEDEEVGLISVSVKTIQGLMGPSHESIEDVMPRLDLCTIGESKMSVRTEGEHIEY